jgi:hypothetical protein
MLHILQVKLVAPRDMPKLGKGGTLASRQALLHSLVVSEQNSKFKATDGPGTSSHANCHCPRCLCGCPLPYSRFN